MVHIGDTEKRYDPNVIRDLLPIMEEGDIVTHLFTANPGGVVDANGNLVPEAQEAPGPRGLAGHGPRTGELQLRRGPTHPGPGVDAPLHQHRPHPSGKAAHGPQHDRDDDPVPGHGLHDGPGRHHVHTEPGQGDRGGRPPWQSSGRQAGRHLGHSNRRKGDWLLYDVLGDSRRHDKAVVPVVTVKRGEVFEAGWGPRPWGWEPDQA